MPRFLVPSYLFAMALALIAGLVGLAIATWMPSDLNMTTYMVTLGLMGTAFATTILASDTRVTLASVFFMVGMMSASYAYMAFLIFIMLIVASAHAPARSPLTRSLG